jgi:hypothetical protein
MARTSMASLKDTRVTTQQAHQTARSREQRRRLRRPTRAKCRAECKERREVAAWFPEYAEAHGEH